jgi:hypothetical protein
MKILLREMLAGSWKAFKGEVSELRRGLGMEIAWGMLGGITI